MRDGVRARPGDARVSRVLHFARAARALGDAARRLGLSVPGFRSPPGLAGSRRTIRRTDWGSVVAVQLSDRELAAVIADMVEGVVVANRLEGEPADRVRRALHAEVAELLHPAERAA